MPRKFAIPIAVLAWIFLASFLWATLIGVNMGTVCGHVLAPWAYLAERIVFLPTIWLTRPLDEWLSMRSAGMAITIGSVIETILLATVYSSILYLLLRRRLFEATGRFLRRFGWPVAAVIAAMIISSIWLRSQLEAADFGAPLAHEAARVKINVRQPVVDPKQRITLTAVRSLPLPELPDLNVIAREGAEPLMISVRTNYIRQPQFHTAVDYLLHRVFPDHVEALPPIPLPGLETQPVGEPRCAHGSASEVMVALAGERSRNFFTMPLATPALTAAPVDLDSPQVLLAPEGTYFVGFGFVPDEGHAARLDFDSHTSHGGDLLILRGSNVLGVIRQFSDHTLNNVAATRTSDGLLHLLATEVAVGNENSSLVHYLRFDPATPRWIAHDVLMVRAKFTSTSTPRIAHNASGVDTYRHNDGGSETQPEDGVYARRIGEPDTWRLISERSEFAVLEDADGRGSTLVAAATHPSESGIVRWFLRRDGVWIDLGQTDAGEKLYTMTNTGTDPFALWRGEGSGTVHAAFNGINHLVIEDLQLP